MCFAKVSDNERPGRVGLWSQLPPVTGSAPALLTALRSAASVPPSLGAGLATGESESVSRSVVSDSLRTREL